VIRIQRLVTVPSVLTTRGVAMAAVHENDYRADRAGFRAGTKTFAFDNGIYGHASVKGALIKMQHGKCAFCESQVRHVAHGDVEHFRPKAGFTRKGVLVRPGYYWLAYDWENLLFACQLCNQRHKRNAFPLPAGSRRVRRPTGNLANEQPLFVDPTREDPARHIEFNEHVVRAVKGDRRGRRTIRGLGLNRDALKRRRETFLEALRIIWDLAAACPKTPQRAAAEAWLKRAQGDTAEYAAMVRCYLAANPLPP